MSRISLKIAAVAAGTAVVCSLVVTQFVEVGPLAQALLIAALTGIGMYLATRRLVSHRLWKAIRLVDDISEQDITPGSELDGDEIDQLYRHVSGVKKSVRDSLQTLRKIESYRKDFLGDISHELKTPIFAVRGFAETLMDGAVDDPDVRIPFLEKIIVNADRLGALAEDLNAITRIETGELRMEKIQFDIGSVVLAVVEQLDPMAQTEEIQLTFRVEERLPPVYGDRERIHQVIRNLAENAIKYTPSGGRTEIIARALDEKLCRISVVDNGIGISDEHIGRITERFFRVDRSRSRGLGGTGLGLAIVKHVLGAHNQYLKVESQLGKGSTFAFDLIFADALGSEVVQA